MRVAGDLPVNGWSYVVPTALPFLFPLTAGPSVNVWQLLMSWACAVALWLLLPRAAIATRLLAWLAMTAALLLCGRGVGPSATVPAALAVVVIYLCAAAGAGMAQGDGKALRGWAWGLVIAGLVSSMLGLLQYYGLADFLVPFTTAPELGQAHGNLRQRNQFASLISMAMIALLWLHACRNRQRRGHPWAAAAVLLIVASAASTSRTGLLQLLLVAGVAAVVGWRERRASVPHSLDHKLPHPAVPIAGIALYFVAAALLPLMATQGVEGMLHRLREGPDTHSRLVLWRNVLDLIAVHPWVGWGWGELKYAHYVTFFDQPRFAEILDNAHNLPLHLAVELGVPAAVLICGGFGALVWGARPWRERRPDRLMAWGVLGAIVLHSLLEYPLWYGPFQLAFGVCLGVLWPAVLRVPMPKGRNRAAGIATPAAAAVTIAVAVGFAARDYMEVSQIYLARDARLARWQDDTLGKLDSSWLFVHYRQFAELALTPVTARNALAMHRLARQLLHFSPEPRVLIRLIESAALLNRQHEALEDLRRFERAFPDDYAAWRMRTGNEP